MRTLREVEAIIRKASEDERLPLSVAEIGRRMRVKRTRPAVIWAAVNELARHGLVAVGGKGVTWAVVSREVWDRSVERLA